MIENSKIDEVLRAAYEQSEYWLLHPRIQILLQQNQPTLDELLIDNNSYFACLITAYNPKSKHLDLQINEHNKQKLIKELERLNLRFFNAVSIDPKEEWPEEQQSGQLTELVWVKV